MKSKTVTGFCSLFGGWFGLQFFYLGKPGLGICMAIISFTFIPLIIGVIMGCVILSMNDDEFKESLKKI